MNTSVELVLLASLPLYFVFIFGLFIGSFLNVLSDRLPREESLLGRSYCESCQHVLTWTDLVPVISFLILRGKCRYCKAPFSVGYPLAEILTGAVFTLTWYMLGGSLYEITLLKIISLAIAACLVVIVLSDCKYQIIPDEIQIALVVLGLIKIFLSPQPLQLFLASCLAACVVMSPILLIFIATKGRGMGFGDVKFALIMGLLLGIFKGLLALYIGFISGALVGVVIILLQRGGMKSKIAFGPFLVLGTYSMLFWGNAVVEWVKMVYGAN